MKTVGRTIWFTLAVSLAFLLGVAVVRLGLDSGRGGSWTVQPDVDDGAEAKMREYRDRCLDLTYRLTAESNRVVEARADYEAEKGANDPLRQQIEKMLGAEIGYQAQIRRLEEASRDLRVTLDKIRRDVTALGKNGQALSNQLAAATSRGKTLEGTVSDLKSRLAQAEKQAADSKVQLQKAQSAQRQGEQKLAAELKKSAALAAELEKLRKPAPKAAAP